VNDRLMNPHANPSNPTTSGSKGSGRGRGTQFIGAGGPARRLSGGKFIGFKGAPKQGGGGRNTNTSDPDRGVFLL
jgi:hypothetical protein